LLRFGASEKVITGSQPSTTNNRMELTAAVQALQALNRPCQVTIYTDSQYLKRGITEWLPAWRLRGWRRKGGPLANADLWRALEAALQPHQVTWQWVRGHAGHRYNERVDWLAREAARQA
jgi:ribonuclease HI